MLRAKMMGFSQAPKCKNPTHDKKSLAKKIKMCARSLGSEVSRKLMENNPPPKLQDLMSFLLCLVKRNRLQIAVNFAVTDCGSVNFLLLRSFFIARVQTRFHFKSDFLFNPHELTKIVIISTKFQGPKLHHLAERTGPKKFFYSFSA